MEYRINKYLSKSGVASRRAAEILISEGKVKVNGKKVTDLATIINSETDIVKVENKLISPCEIKYYVLLNKPAGYITTMSDPFDRKNISQLLPEKYLTSGVMPVGRLDKDTTGLLFLTNDGETAYKLMHPKFNCEKKYHVNVSEPLKEIDQKKIEKGVYLKEFHTKPCKIEVLDDFRKNFLMTISEGKKRQIRITLLKFGYKVRKLKRISIGPLKLGNIASGMHHQMKPHEVKKLLAYLDRLSE
ncbi:MAG: rRNA pseudouridine synthase [Spirochaetes bacterium]|nr:rRNA pseudouridine synthase [Spirochaetota bacterium]